MVEPIPQLSVNRFERDGFLIVRGLAEPELRSGLRDAVLASLDPLRAPVEYEADVGYPSAPPSREAPGGATPRRLLHAYSRDEVFRQWAGHPQVSANLKALLGSEHVQVSQCHHNCIMTKHPGFSSLTSWHQDIRYWSFDEPELISVWLALGREREENGALWVIPGSHRADLQRGRLDRDLFLRTDIAENRALIEQAQMVSLDAGDVLFFHCRSFHAAGKNDSDEVKLSAAFTYHAAGNRPIPGTRSSQYPSIPI